MINRERTCSASTRATGFYASLRVIGFLSVAIAQGNATSVRFLRPVLDQLLSVAERA